MNNPILGKIDCIYKCKFLDLPTKKKGRTGKKRVVTSELNEEFKEYLKKGIEYIVTGKIDGTCCLIKDNSLKKRRDVKKGRNIPNTWVQTSINEQGVKVGFMDLDENDKYHLASLSNDKKKIKIVKQNENLSLSIENIDISKINEKTVELIGPKVQSNLHGLNQNVIVPHGSIKLNNCPKSFDLTELKNWFTSDKNCDFFEGIVVHFSNGKCFKVHRHHLDLPVKRYSNLLDFNK